MIRSLLGDPFSGEKKFRRAFGELFCIQKHFLRPSGEFFGAPRDSWGRDWVRAELGLGPRSESTRPFRGLPRGRESKEDYWGVQVARQRHQRDGGGRVQALAPVGKTARESTPWSRKTRGTDPFGWCRSPQGDGEPGGRAEFRRSWRGLLHGVLSRWVPCTHHAPLPQAAARNR
jgi:hypothetical protein